MEPKVVNPEEFNSKEFLDKIQEKLDIAKSNASEIEHTNDKSKRVEWRELKKYIKWAEHLLETHKKS